VSDMRRLAPVFLAQDVTDRDARTLLRRCYRQARRWGVGRFDARQATALAMQAADAEANRAFFDGATAGSRVTQLRQAAR
jgi:hypothetical protein